MHKFSSVVVNVYEIFWEMFNQFLELHFEISETKRLK